MYAELKSVGAEEEAAEADVGHCANGLWCDNGAKPKVPVVCPSEEE